VTEMVTGLDLVRLQLTVAGELLAGHARAVLHTLADADEALVQLRGLRTGRIRIGITSTAKYFAPKLVARFARAHPDVELRLSINNREAIDAQLADNAVDLAIMGRPPEHLDCMVAPFADHPLVVIAPPDHPLAGKSRVPLGRLAAEPFLVREPGSGTRAAMERFFAEHGLTVRIAMEMPSNESVKQAVIAGLGLAFLSRHTVALERQAGVLALVSAPHLPVMRKWNVVHLRDKSLSPAATAFKQFVVAEVAANCRGGAARGAVW